VKEGGWRIVQVDDAEDRVLWCANVNHVGVATPMARGSFPQKVDEVREDLLLGLREVAAGVTLSWRSH
jgi:hypothetical protein